MTATTAALHDGAGPKRRSCASRLCYSCHTANFLERGLPTFAVVTNFWAALKKIAGRHRVTLSNLIGSIDSQRQHGNLSSAVRLFVLQHYRQRVEETAHPDVSAATTEMQPRNSIE